jgi:RNA polymerase sigma-70 factor (ECF subfamily)
MASDETAILHQAIGGNPAAFESLVRTYQKKAYIVAYGFVGNREDAVDLAQESFARAFKALDRFDESLPFYPWLHRIVRNVCLNFLRKKRRHGEISLNDMVDKGYDPPDDETPDRTAELGELSKAISAAMFQLPHDQREILVLRHLQEMSYSEIATCLGIPQGTVMSRLHSARINLRGLLEDIKESSLGPRKED